MKKNVLKRVFSLALALIMAMSLVACGSADEETTEDTAGTETDASENSEAWIALSMNAETLDLTKTSSLGCRQVSLGTVWERLVTLNSTGEPVPELCESYEMSEDARTFTFHLRHGVLFHDGSDLTDDGYLKNYIGTGPYQFTEFEQDQYIRLDRFDDYVPYGEEGYVDGMAGYKDASIQTLYYTYVKEASTRIAGLQTGQYDLIYSLSSDNFDVIANADGMETKNEEAGALILVLNKMQGLCTDVNFRKAVNAALSMDDILTVGYGSFYNLSSCYMDESNGFWLTDAGSESYNQANQELAKEYLAQSSYQPGDVFTILTTNENNRDKLALVIASQLEAIGITCEVEAYDYPTMNSYTYDPSLYDMYVMSYSSVPLPTLKAYLSTGDSFWTTDETYQAYISQFNQATTKEEAYKIWETIQAYCWNDYLPVINCGHYQECYAWNANTLSNVNIYNNIVHMWSASLS